MGAALQRELTIMASSIEIDVSANIAKFKTAMDKAAIEGGKLNKKLDKAFGSIGKAMKAVGALAGVAVAGGLAAMVKSSINAADAIQKLGVRTGASAEFLSEMRFALSQSDVSAKEFENSLIKLNKSTKDAGNGLSTPIRAFNALGISVKEFDRLNTDEKFTTLSEAISRVEDPATRTQVSMDLLGRSGSQLLTVMQDGAKGIEAFREESVRLGQSLSQNQVEKAAAANDAIDKLTKSISGAFSQAVLDNIGFIQDLGFAFDHIKLIGIALVQGLLTGFEEIKGGVRILGEAIKLAFFGSFDLILESYSKMLVGIASGLDKVPFLDGQAESVRDFADSVSNVITPLDNFNEATARINSETDQAKNAIIEIMDEQADYYISSKQSAIQIDRASESTRVFSAITEKASSSVKKSKDDLKELTDTMNELNKVTAEAKNRFGEFKTSSQLVTAEVKKNNQELNKSKIIFDELKFQYKSGVISLEEYKAATKSLGLETKESTGAMKGYWDDFTRGSFDSFKSFARSTLDDFGSLKDGFKSLTENLKDLALDTVADLIATFSSNALKNVFSNLFGGDKDGAGGGFIDSIKSLFGGGGSGESATGFDFSSVSKIFSSGGGIGKLFAKGGIFGKGGSIATSFSNLAAIAGPVAAAIASIAIGRKLTEDITGNTGRLLGTVGGVAGGLLAKALEGLGIIGNARTKQELAEDQLGAVNQAISEGRTKQVDLGQVNGVSVGFRGGFDENSTFFDIGGSPEIQEKVAQMLVANFGFDQARVVEDGILRLEDFSREYSQNNEQIVSEVKASIASVSLSITDLEKNTLSSLDGTLVQLDRLFDESANTGESAADRLAKAYSLAFDTTIQAGSDWVKSTGIDAERIKEIFDNTSGDVTESLFDVSEAGKSAFSDLAKSAQMQSKLIGDSFRTNIQNSINTSNLNNVPAIAAANDPASSGNAFIQDNSLLIDSVQRLTSQVSEQQEEIRLSRLKPNQRLVVSR